MFLEHQQTMITLHMQKDRFLKHRSVATPKFTKRLSFKLPCFEDKRTLLLNKTQLEIKNKDKTRDLNNKSKQETNTERSDDRNLSNVII